MRNLNKFIAIADDHSLLRKQLSDFIRYHGFTVLFDAFNGQDCLSQMEKQTILPDLCILDVQMPEMDGFLTTRRIKESWPGVRIVLYSMKDDEQTVEKAWYSGADAFVGKSWQPHEILDAIRKLLQTY
jgi:DNA-binding NarL/FixJ family response regulator